MDKLSDNDIHERLEMLMARRTAKHSIKFITTNHLKHVMAFELHGEL